MRLNKKVSIFTPKLHVFLLHISLNYFSINTLAADLYPLSEKIWMDELGATVLYMLKMHIYVTHKFVLVSQRHLVKKNVSIFKSPKEIIISHSCDFLQFKRDRDILMKKSWISTLTSISI